VIIGREDADLTIADPQLSRRHAVVRPSARGVVIEDLGSANGTFVDGVRISEAVTLTPGATVRVGGSEIALEVPSPSRTAQTLVSGRSAAGAVTPAHDPHTEQCPSCHGMGVTATGSQVEGQSMRTCVNCDGLGYRELPHDVLVARMNGPAQAVLPAAPPAAEAAGAYDEPGPPRRRGARRLIGFVVLVAIAAAAAAIAIVLLTRSGGTTSHAFDAGIKTLPLAAPTSVIASGILDGPPLGHVEVIIQRRLAGTPIAGGPPVPFQGNVLIFSQHGFMSLNVRGSVQVSKASGEAVRARGVAANGTGDYEGVTGSFTLTGGNTSPLAAVDELTASGTLKY
jgi:hypothetical protein